MRNAEIRLDTKVTAVYGTSLTLMPTTESWDSQAGPAARSEASR
jgi:hypothetical protein